MSRAKHPLAARDSWKGQNPEVEAPHTGPSVHDGRSCRANVMRVRWSRKRVDHLLRGEHSEEVKSQERCRDETSPARRRGAKIVKRVTKP
jgi:hypothetical protein